MSTESLWLLNGILALMMFGIALSLHPTDFKRVVKHPRAPLVGMLAQFLLLPLASFGLTMLLPLSPEVMLGILLVGSCPGGSFSNIMTFLAKGNVALSVSMTALASVAAALMTPFNFALYASLNPHTAALLQRIHVPVENIFLIVTLVLAIPLLLGLWVARIAPGFAHHTQRHFRLISLLTLFGFVGIALAKNWQTFVAGAGFFLLVVVLHNAMALGIGRLCAKVARVGDKDARAITLEVGIQNSGLGLGIIFTFFSDLQGMAIVAAAWGIWHLVSGLALSHYWSRREPQA
ncbi:bile acid:sodium symporter family protein [Bowmanella sp. JS7-9]|uniref:Bile acid:sodium symporter family protein n=1 Tax=Pseudobowmanella zhangzhouensis TaxID=1537679 RepID=A0ABW1XI84_9ALTE|nr:bile acid:sodium symporter family protein [Bowmanella sp. JS7-9]TBX27405.1 bile acid:sodium symporter [Bowmanella sp. JS7-9]